MDISLIQAQMIRVGDLIEHPNLQVFRPVIAIDKQYGRLWFIFGDQQPRSCYVDDFILAVTNTQIQGGE